MGRLTQILDRVAAIQRTIPGIVAAYPVPPFDVPTANTPCFINIPMPSAADAEFHAAGLQRIEDVIQMDLVVAWLESGASLVELTRKALELRDAVFSAFARRMRLSDPATGEVDLDFVAHAYIASHGPLHVAEIGTARALVYRFILRVTEKFAEAVAP